MLNNQVALLWLTPQPTFLWHSRSLNHSRLPRYQKSKSLYTVTVPVAQFSVQLVGEELEEFCKMFPAIDRAVIQVRFTIFPLFNPMIRQFYHILFLQAVFVENQGNKETTVNSLLQMGSQQFLVAHPSWLLPMECSYLQEQPQFLLSGHDCLSDCKASKLARNLMHLIQLKIQFHHFSVLVVILERFFLIFLLNYNSNCGNKIPCDNQTLIYTDLWKGKPFDMLYTQSIIHYTGSQSPAIAPSFLISCPYTLHMT